MRLLSFFHSAHFFLKAAFACLLLGVLVFYLEPSRLWDALERIRIVRIAPVAFLTLLGLLVQSAKWKLLLGYHRPEATWREAVESLLVGFGLGLLSPGRLGEVGRGIILSGGNRIALLGWAVLDRSSSSIVTLICGGVAGWILYPQGRRWIAGAFLGLSWMIFLGLRARTWSRWKRLAVVGDALRKIPVRGWGGVLVGAFFFNVIFFFQLYLLLEGGQHGADGKWVWGIPLVFAVKTALPLGIMDLGVREGAAVLVFSRLGLDPALAFDAAFILFVLNVLFPGMVGLGVIFRGRNRIFARMAESERDEVVESENSSVRWRDCDEFSVRASPGNL